MLHRDGLYASVALALVTFRCPDLFTLWYSTSQNKVIHFQNKTTTKTKQNHNKTATKQQQKRNNNKTSNLNKTQQNKTVAILL
jgi:hypothetical protein